MTLVNNISLILKNYNQKIILFFSILLFLSIIPSPNIYYQNVPKTDGIKLVKEIKIPSPPKLPVKNNDALIPLISAEGVLIKDITSGIVLYSKDDQKRFPPASTTKIITALVALDYYHLDDVLKVKTVIYDGRTMGLVKDEKITFESLLYGMLIHSANDAAYVLAENYPGGVEKFVTKMNQKVQQLYLENTHYTNPAGFDDDNQYTTALDLVKVSLFAMNNKTFSKIVSTKRIVVSDIDYIYFHDLQNVNELLGKIAGVSGVKTGFTQNAGEILVSEVKKNGTSLIIVVLKSKDRFGETEKLIDWVFQNYTWLPFDMITPTTQ